MRKRTVNVVEAAVRAVGIRKGLRVASYAAEWALVANELGRPPTAEEVGKSWGWASAKSFRRQAEWREAFPNVPTPEPLWRAAEDRLSKMDLAGAVSVVSQLPAPT